MRTITICRGIPASGKSTWAKENARDNTVRINRDDIRKMLGYSFNNYDNNLETIITDVSNKMIEDLLNKDYNIIIDNLNLKQSYVNDIHAIAERIGNVSVREKHFPIALETALGRNAVREEAVPASVIRDLHKRFKNIKINNAVDYFKSNKVIQQDETLPHCVICDLDGTLALFDNKNPYERDFENDVVNIPILIILYKYDRDRIIYNHDKHIIFVSGRSSKFRDVTSKWLNEAGFDVVENMDDRIHLVMRKEGDNRKDSIVKQEMYDKYIKDKYYVDFVLDDRNQVVDMWRRNGLTCLQVAEGNF